MRMLTLCCVTVGVVMSGQAVALRADEPMLAHDVYFTLKQKSDEATSQLVAGCREFLADHPGVVWFAAGARATGLAREVNDRDFDVALHIVFQNKAAHDRYQKADAHHQFIEKFQDNWASVRVFDSYVNVSSHVEVPGDRDRRDRPDEAGRPRLPDAATLFAGMIHGKVVAKYDSGEFALAVDRVVRQWQHSKARDAESMVGRTILVRGREPEAAPIARFIARLKVGETITIDVAHRGEGEAVTLLELTPQQRERLR